MAGRFASSVPDVPVTHYYKDTTTSAVSRFDWVTMSASGTIVRLTTSTSNLDVWGIALDDSASGDSEPIRVIRNDGYGTAIEFIYDLEAAGAVVAGELLAFGTLQMLVNTNTDAIMICTRNNSGSSATEVRCALLIKAKSNCEYLGDAS